MKGIRIIIIKKKKFFLFETLEFDLSLLIDSNNLLYIYIYMHRGLWPSGRGKVFLSLSPGFEPQRARLSPPRCLTCLLGLQGIQWVRGLVVVRVSWLGHPGLKKKKDSYIHVLFFFFFFLKLNCD
jgi:hypothetical protein